MSRLMKLSEAYEEEDFKTQELWAVVREEAAWREEDHTLKKSTM